MIFDPFKAVYCYFFPEIRQVMQDVQAKVQDSLFLNITPVNAVRELSELFTPSLEISATSQGNVNLDEIHIPIIKRMVDAYSDWVPALGSFQNAYPTSGSSEGIREIMKKVQMRGFDSISVFRGEYEGYKAYAEMYGMKVSEVSIDSDLSKLRPGFWFISNPSAIDGDIIPNEKIRELCDLGNRVAIDLAYVGSTRRHEFDISHENIDYAVISLSKPYGLFRFRIGYAFSKEPIDAMYGNKWFKDVTRMLQGLKAVEEYPLGALHEQYFGLQESIITGLNREYGLGIVPSDVLLLGNIKDASGFNQEQLEMVSTFRRGDSYRLCLTPYFERMEHESSSHL